MSEWSAERFTLITDITEPKLAPTGWSRPYNAIRQSFQVQEQLPNYVYILGSKHLCPNLAYAGLSAHLIKHVLWEIFCQRKMLEKLRDCLKRRFQGSHSHFCFQLISISHKRIRICFRMCPLINANFLFDSKSHLLLKSFFVFWPPYSSAIYPVFGLGSLTWPPTNV